MVCEKGASLIITHGEPVSVAVPRQARGGACAPNLGTKKLKAFGGRAVRRSVQKLPVGFGMNDRPPNVELLKNLLDQECPHPAPGSNR